MNKKIFTVFAVFFGVMVLAAADFVRGTVNADLLNMRVKPGIREAVAGKIVENTEVQITRVCGNWLEIKAPENLKIFSGLSKPPELMVWSFAVNAITI